jgi:hypothetical protein
MKLKVWQAALLSLFLYGLSIYLYFDLTKMEEEGSTRRIHVLLVFLYRLGGKWAVVIPFFVVASIAAYGAYVVYRGPKSK